MTNKAWRARYDLVPQSIVVFWDDEAGRLSERRSVGWRDALAMARHCRDLGRQSVGVRGATVRDMLDMKVGYTYAGA